MDSEYMEDTRGDAKKIGSNPLLFIIQLLSDNPTFLKKNFNEDGTYKYSNRTTLTHPYVFMFSVALVLWIVYQTFKNII